MSDKKIQMKLEQILANLDIVYLSQLETYILQSPEYRKLFRCTQMRDAVLRTDNDDSANRGLHTIQVAENAAQLAENLLTQNSSRELTEEEKKQIKIARIVGIAHDLGHTPMGHATEVVFSEKLKNLFGENARFGHDEYSGIIFSGIFKRFVTAKFQDPDIGLSIGLSEEEQRMFTDPKAETFIPIKDYIINGVQNHGKYLSTWARDNSRMDLPLICGRLADTLSFMPADLMDLSQVERATGPQGEILTEEIMLNLVDKGITTHIWKAEEELTTEKISAIVPIGQYFQQNNPEFNYKGIIAQLLRGNRTALSDIQARILTEVAKANLSRLGSENEPIVAISDSIKVLRDSEIKTRGKQDVVLSELDEKATWGIREYETTKFNETYQGDRNSEEYKKALEQHLKTALQRTFNDYKEILQTEMDSLRKTCPTLALVYEIQDELIYNQILTNTLVLGNDEKVNKTIIGAEFDKYEQAYTGLSEQEKQEFDSIYSEFSEYMWLFSTKEEETKEALAAKKAKAYAIYRVQQLSNDDIDRIRETRDLREALKEIGRTIDLEDLSIEETEEFKKKILQDRQDNEETVHVTPKMGEGELAARGETSSIRVSVFGKDSWKKIVGDRRLESLQAIYSEVKQQTRDGREAISQETGLDERE